MSNKYAAMIIVVLSFLACGAQAESQVKTDTHAQTDSSRVDQAISALQALCLVGNKYELRVNAEGELELARLLEPGGKIDASVELLGSRGSVDIDDAAVRAVADQNTRDCIRPYIKSIINTILGNQGQIPPQPNRHPHWRTFLDVQAYSPEPPTSVYDCRAFYPSLPANIQDFLDQHLGSNLASWRDVSSSADLMTRLDLSRISLKDSDPFKSLGTQDQWRALLWEQCDLLNHDMLPPGPSFERFKWLANDIYPHVITEAPQNDGTQCSEDAPLPNNALRMWLIWMAYNNHFYSFAVLESLRLDDDFGKDAEDREKQVGHVDIPAPGDSAAGCAVLKNGPLNDVATARWVRAKSLCIIGKDAHDPLNALTRVEDGLGYDPRDHTFWRPSAMISCHSN
jgi:hypothetical protein